MSQRNEGRACDAVVKVLERRTGEERTDLSRPDTGDDPPVELRLKLGSRKYAIEHTQLEAFEGQVATGVSLGQLTSPVTRSLTGVLPAPARYIMCFPIDPSLGVKRAQLKQHVKNLIEWVRENAKQLHRKVHERLRSEPILLQRDYCDSITDKPQGFPYEITLSCRVIPPPFGQKPGTLDAMRWEPDDKEALRKKRLERALSDKSLKLQRCKEEGARTVLVLESDDIALTSYDLVGAALVALAKEPTDKSQFPDEIYFVETFTDPWIVWPMKCDAEYRPVDEWSGWNRTEFQEDELTDLTMSSQ